jgi:hypothetical protein
MPLFSAFTGGSHTERSLAINAERTVNLYRSTVESQGAAKQAYLTGTPGLRPLGEVGTSGCRGRFTQDGRTWAVIGATLYEETFGPYTSTARGTIVDDGLPVSCCSNGDGGGQLAIVGGGQLKILDLVTHVLTGAIVLPLVNAPVMIGFLDGYFVLSERDTLRGWFSAVENGLLWDALDFFTRSTASDRIVALVCANNRVWLFGSETSEAYEDVGDADNPFQPIKGSLFQIGCGAAWSVSVGVQTMRWLGRSSRGGAVVYRLDGYNGTRISTHAEEARLGAASTLADAEGLTYEQDGHLFYALTCPSMGVAGETIVVDETEQGQWHDRSWWNAALGREEQWRVRGHACVGQLHVVGSWDAGAVWALDLTTYDDDGDVLRAVRRAPYVSSDNTYAFLDRIELGVETGVGLANGQGSDPQIELRISKDSGKTWFSAGNAGIGKMGEGDTRAFWTRLGRVRLDRLVLEVVITDPVKRVLGPGLWIDVTPARHARAA